MSKTVIAKKNSKPKQKVWEWSPVDPLDVLVVDKDRKMSLGGAPITDIELKNLQQEVKALKAFRLWGIFQETIKQKAIDRGFLESLDWEQTLSGKMMVHNLGILRSIVEVIEKATPTSQPIAPPRQQRHG